MSVLELLVIAIGLSMDAFSVSVCKGLSVEKVQTKHVLLCGLFFGIFQAVMPAIGYFIGSAFANYVEKFDHWVAFVLLLYIGINMIKEAKQEEKMDADFSLKTMTLMAIATSIDALTIGVSFAFLKVNLLISVLAIGLITFTLSCIGVVLGHKIGSKFSSRAEILGGAVLIILGIKILIEHTFFG
ncbi:MAG: manganese efflux pump MntP family protein [Erysipelotrichia bacterium]|nr:manganese efflux pump MntP family protein [Erysipelotrichia bacterium]